MITQSVVVSSDDANAFANGLIQLADNPDSRREHGLNARSLAEKSFSREDLSNKFVNVLEEIYKN